MSLIPDGGDTTTEETTTEVVTKEESHVTDGEQPEVKYLYADGIGGEGEAPEWFKGDKYKTISEQAKGYSELESKFGSFTGAPKEGKYEIEGVDLASNPLMGVVAEWGAENQLSNDGMSQLFAKVAELSNKQIEEDQAQAMKDLGEDAPQRLKALADWGKNNLEAEEFATFKALGQTANEIALIEKMISKSKNSKIIDHDPDVDVSTIDTLKEEVKTMQLATNEKGQRLIEVDMDHRKKLNAKKTELQSILDSQ